ncbi:MAG: ribosome biogenesis GTP-binding protein YihA/YsxC [Gemmatimonadaceae bacterium]
MQAMGTVEDRLVVREIEFLGGMASASGWRPEPVLPEIAFAGRSNVGKSSLLNRLVTRRNFARVSRTPGRTREINFFGVNGRFVFVDLPGYGYARVSKERRDTWRPLIEGYLERSPQLRGVVQLLDVRRDPGEDDRRMLDYLAELGAPTIVAVTKIDKLTPAAARERANRIAASAGLDDDQVIPFSAVTSEGRDDLAGAIMSLLAAPPWRAR